MKRLKYLAEINPPLPRNRVPKPDDEVSFLPMERIGEEGSLDLSEVRPARDISKGYTAMIDGDLVIAKITPCFENGKGALCYGLHGGMGFGTTELIVLRAKSKSDSGYLYWLTRGYHFRNWGEAEMRGSAGQKRVTEEFVANYRSADLKPADQRRIAAYLDEATGKVDRLVALRRRQMELLREQRAALIQQAVTRGLNPRAPLKDSGIPWLGQVPEHWKLTRIKRESRMISKGTTPSTIGSEFVDTGVRFLKAENICDGAVSATPVFFITDETHRELFRSQLKSHDLLVVIAGATTGKSGVLPIDLTPANLNQAVSFIRFKTSNMSLFCNEWMATPCIQEFVRQTAVQSAQPNLSMQDLGNIPIVTMPDKELEDVLRAIHEIKERFDRLNSAYTRQLELLAEYRASLIHECVTGQRAVGK
jgi:type I restriction enzyme S subunit